MAVLTVISRPQAILHTNNNATDFFAGAIDGNASSYGEATLYGTGTATAIYGSFDFSQIPAGAKINNIKVYVKAYSSRTITLFSCRLVKNAEDQATYTDLGDGAKDFVSDASISSSSYKVANYPIAASAVDTSFLKNGSLQARLYLKTAGVLTSTTIRLYDLYVEVEYTPLITVTVNASPAEGGTVTGGGTYESGSTVTATATPNSGYVFSHWLVNGANAGSSNPISGTLDADTTVTAIFEKSGVNNIFIGTAQPKEIYIGTQKVKGIYIGTTAVYET